MARSTWKASMTYCLQAMSYMLHAVFRATCYGLLAILLAGCAGLQPRSQEMVLARVNGEAITGQDLEEAFTQSHRGHGIFLAGKGAVRQFLEKVIDKRLLLQEARRIGLDQDPEIQEVLEERRGKRAAEEFYRDEVQRKVVIPEEAVLAAYERLKDRFQVRHILVESREEAERALDRIKAGEAFGEVARQVSLAPTANRGGDIGIVQWGKLDPVLEARLWSLEKGQVSEPFQTEEGWNLLYVVERVTVERPTLEESRSSLKAILTQRETRRRSEALFRHLMARWNGVIHEKALLEILRARRGEELPGTMVVAEAGGERISLNRFLPRVNLEAAQKLPPAKALKELRWLLEEDLFRILLRKEALARGYGERPEIVRELEQLRANLAVDQLLSRVILADLQVSDQEMEGYYQAHPEEFTEPEAVRMRIILVETEEEARAVMSELQVGKDFASLARKVSKDQASAGAGGEIGWIRKGQLMPELEKVAFSLKEGGVGMVRTRAGYSVIRVEERKEAQLKPLSEVREQARQKALRQKSQETLKRWVMKLREASVIQIDDEAIRRAIAAYEETLRQKATTGEEEKKP